MSYDRAITVFSPDGHLFQVEYAGEAVKKGLCSVGVKGKDVVVLAVEKKSVQKLQDGRTIRKIYKLDDHAYAAFAGMSADARVLVQRVQLQCQSFRLNYEDTMDVDFIVRHLAELQQKATQSGGRRPYGVATIVGGFNSDGTPQLWMTEPSGMATAWKAVAIGNNSKAVLDSLENGHKPDLDKEAAKKLAVKALLEVVESGSRNIELTILSRGGVAEFVSEDELAKLSEVLEKEREEERKKKRRVDNDDQ
jgi:20S proteasome subunit alpha 4